MRDEREPDPSESRTGSRGVRGRLERAGRSQLDLPVALVCPVFLALLFQATPARAQANYDAAVLGGRTAMMGGASTARGSDGAVLFTNPAGITRIPGESFSFGTVAAAFSHRFVDNITDPNEEYGFKQPGTNELDFRILPNTFCLFLDGAPTNRNSQKSRHKYGICVADVEQETFLSNENRESSQGALSISTRSQFRRSTAVASWGVELMRGTSIGVSARLENSGLDDTTNESVIGSDGSSQIFGYSRRGLSWDSSITIGVSQLVSKHVTLGASLTTPSQHIIGFYKGSNSVLNGGDAGVALNQDDGDYSYNTPAAVRLGVAFAWPSFNLEFDANIYAADEAVSRARFTRTSFNDASSGSGDVTRAELTERARPVTNISLGIERFIQRDFSILAGFQTDFTGIAPRVDGNAADTLFRQERDSYSFAIGVSSYGSAGSILLGLRGTYSDGTILVPDPASAQGAFRALPQMRYTIALILAGQLSFEGVRDTALRAASPLLPAKGGTVP